MNTKKKKRFLRTKKKRKDFEKFKREYKKRKVILDVKSKPKPTFKQKVIVYTMMALLFVQRLYFKVRLWLAKKKCTFNRQCKTF